MYRPQLPRAAKPRRGVILLVVLALLTLFAVLGLGFVLYAGSQARSAWFSREATGARQPDTDPELLLAFFLGQLIYDVRDDESGVYSALRGHSLARSMFGLNCEPGDAPDAVAAKNAVPFNGTGRLHTGPPGCPYLNPFGIDDYKLINYTFFRDDPRMLAQDRFLRDPERLAPSGRPKPWRTIPSQERGPFTGGFNAPYTYPDLNNLFLAAVKADGTVLTPSFHREWLFGRLDDRDNPNWTNTPGKYLMLRPRPQENPGFPYPEDRFGDVKNMVGAPGGNDSVWLDLNFPLQVAPDGRKFKPLFAALVVDLDSRINVNVHGNARGPNRAHVSNQGWGPWEVNPCRLVDPQDRDFEARRREWSHLLTGHPGLPHPGRYGPDRQPGRRDAVAQRTDTPPHFYGQVDFDGYNEGPAYHRPSGRLLLPGFGAPPLQSFPSYVTPPAGTHAGYGNGSEAERTNHPLLYNVLRPGEDGADDRLFGASNLEALLRYGDTGSPALTSELFRLCPLNFADRRTRTLVTTHSFDVDKPGMMPWLYDPLAAPYRLRPGSAEAPAGAPAAFPSLAQRLLPPPPGSEFSADWRAGLAALGRVDLNRPLTPYPLLRPQAPATYSRRFDAAADPAAVDQFLRAQGDRQNLADDIYRRLLAVTGVSPVRSSGAFGPANPSDADLRPRRWLAQLAANVVDFLDEDGISTPFHFYTAADAAAPDFNGGALTSGDPDQSGALPRYWVFGTELPRVVLNEVLAEYQRAGPGGLHTNRVWAELHNPFQAPPPGAALQPQDGFPAPFTVDGLGGASANPNATPAPYGPYRLVVANQLLPRSRNNDNVLGKPDQVRAQATDSDFLAPGSPSGIVPQGFYLLGPPGPDGHHTLGAVPPDTPFLRSPNLAYQAIYTSPPDDRTTGVTVLLRRLANSHIPFDPNPSTLGVDGGFAPNPWYNPYLTVDYLERVPLQNADQTLLYASWGKRQPYAADFSQASGQRAPDPAQPTQHTFGLPNNPPPWGGRYDWLVHLDRRLVSPMELLHVSGYQPHQLTHRFITRRGLVPHKFDHYVPWFDPARRLYRVFEFLETRPLMRGLSLDPGDRVPGKVNLNTVWDPEVLLALCDPQESNHFAAQDVHAIFREMLARRSPDYRADGTGGPGPGDRPFLGLAAGYSTGDQQNPVPAGLSIEDTLLCSADGGARRLFQLPAGRVPARHPYLQDELLTKMFNHLTTRSHVFAVWLTVGFFEVTDDSTRPVKLGAEFGRAEGRHLRRRAFAVVDRSPLTANPGPQPHFDPRAAPSPGCPTGSVVLYLSVID